MTDEVERRIFDRFERWLERREAADREAHAEMVESIRALQEWKSGHDATVNEKWKHRDAQDVKDAERFASLHGKVNDVDKQITVLRTKITVWSTIGAVFGGAAMQVLLKLFG